MDRAFASGASASPPTAPASPSIGYATAGNPGGGASPTKPGPYWFHMITEELRYLVTQAGLTPDQSNLTQIKQALDTLYGSGQKPGEICAFARSTAPSGFLKANGAAVSRATYAALFAAIGTAFGAGDGSTTFNLPDARGEFIRGWDDSRGIDTGRTFGSWQSDDLKSHTHTIPNVYNNMAAQGGSTANPLYQSGSVASGASGGTETRPRNLAFLVCIKY